MCIVLMSRIQAIDEEDSLWEEEFFAETIRYCNDALL